MDPLATETGEETIELPHHESHGSLIVESGEAGGRSVRLRPGQRIRIGSSAEVDLRVSDRAVSGAHVELIARDGCVEVVDLGSKNGVLLGGARVRAATLPSTAAFVIGRTAIAVRRGHGLEPDIDAPIPGMVGHSGLMRRLGTEIRRIAPLRAAVLVQGESGSGKDVVARALHALGGRSGAYVPVNVSALPEALAEADLFGHRRGAFTGAVSSRAGAFELADRGTLFLDEIGDLAPSVQAKLLRVVEDGEVRALGAAETRRVDVRIVSATWAPLPGRVLEGRFREDLYHRISTFVLRVPPLRERRTDIPALADALLARIAPEVGPKTLSSRALARLVSYSWPGNVRELASVLYRASVRSESEAISAAHVEIPTASARPARVPGRPENAHALLDEHGGNLSAAARAAGVARSTFRAWIEERALSPGGPPPVRPATHFARLETENSSRPLRTDR